ncbi:unnamed protein product [Pieris macdunnoughi]|uniref:Uncharacterized protein n=1 Tax=Pieris macdunnoughi TaxID=345717 RepID=A0A821W2F8_9NEOP|nr:unnamed protein product [Pieris macdunnoughi]
MCRFCRCQLRVHARLRPVPHSLDCQGLPTSSWHQGYGLASKKPRPQSYRAPLGRAETGRNPAPATLDELRDAVIEEWDNIPQEHVVTLIRSMTDRLEVGRRARGGNTRF